MAEMILPGVYITVRDEGLISVGGVSVGNIGVVGTATVGEDEKVEVLSSFSEAKKKFGEADEGTTLVKSLELMFGNGASAVYAVKAKAEGDANENYQAALAKLENELVHIVLLAGQDVSSGMTELLRAHIEVTSGIKRERIALVGCEASIDPVKIGSEEALAQVKDDAGRMVYAAPGVSMKKRNPATGETTEEKLSGAYTAAALAGLLATLPVQASPTNKVLNLSGLAVDYDYAQLEGFVQNGVLVVEKRAGYRVVKGITTSTNNVWSQITTRRIVDKAIYGVRAACNPYIGKLNNVRVRGALKATMDGFLTRMVGDEALVGYKLDVSATRAEEISGQCMVTLTLQPTFSIDYILVTMYLG